MSSRNKAKPKAKPKAPHPAAAKLFSLLKGKSDALVKLDLSTQRLGDSGTFALARRLRGFRQLVTLNLSYNRIGARGAEAIARELVQVPQIQRLVLPGNRIGVDGVTALAAQLVHLPCLTHLCLDDNLLGTDGVIALADKLPTVPNLAKLFVSKNRMRDRGLVHLARALQDTPEVCELNLYANEVTGAGGGVRALVVGLPALQQLRKVNLLGNELTEEAVQEIAACRALVPGVQILVAAAEVAVPADAEERVNGLGVHVELEANLVDLHAEAVRLVDGQCDAVTQLLVQDNDAVFAELDAALAAKPNAALPSVLPHVRALHNVLVSPDATASDAPGVSPASVSTELERSRLVLEERKTAALERARQASLSTKDHHRLREAREQHRAALDNAVQHAAHTAEQQEAVDNLTDQLTKLQASLADSLGAVSGPPAADFSPFPANGLSSFLSSAASTLKQLASARTMAIVYARALTAQLRNVKTLHSQLAGEFVSALGTDAPDEVGDALQHNVAARLHTCEEHRVALANAGASLEQRIARLDQMKTTVEMDVADADDLPALEDRLEEAQHAMSTAEEELEDRQTKLRRLIRRKRLTPEERIKHEDGIAEQQRQVAELRGEAEQLQRTIERLADENLPEAVQLLTKLRNDQDIPEVLHMLRPTGLCRHRNLTMDYQDVDAPNIVLDSARYQMRVVRPVGNDEVKVLKAFPTDRFKQIRNEVVNVARVEHPNVLRPELVFLSPDEAFVWMQYPYMAHGSLDRWLVDECIPQRLRGGELLSREGHELLRAVFRELLDGVVHLHANGVVHNDIKPANVLMGDDDVPRICDFELSSSIDVAGTRGLGSMTVRGLTVNYAAPEVMSNQRSTEQSDMYSLGRLMYDTLLHEWLAEQCAAPAASHFPGLVSPDALAFPDDVHPAFCDLVERLLSTDPQLRPSAVEARAHPFFAQVLFDDAAPTPHEIQLDMMAALHERQFWGTDGSDPAFHVVDLDLRTPEAVGVVALFRSRGCPRRQVESVHRVQNLELLRRFAFHKHHLEEKYGGAVGEQLVFHGTKPHVVDGIVAQGFDMRLNGVNGTAFGQGNYFAHDSSYSAGGTYSPADGRGVKYMFVARILVGETVRGNPQMRRPERPDGTLVDTAVDSEANPSIYVTFDNGQAMPVYVISFR